jgi:nucleoside-diphosphate-sugar epimerase
MRILVTGGSGFAGSLLIPRLLRAGHEVLALGREPARIESALAASGAGEDLGELQLLRGDVLTGAGLAAAMDEVEVAYYLIHSMERAAAGASDFGERERIAARTFAGQAARSGVRRIVYLGGLLPRPRASGDIDAEFSLSPHLASRLAVERTLLQAVPDSLALRASIVIGARSRSFRLLVRLVERMPVLALPAWHRFRTQPIDERDVIEMLAASANADVGGRSLDVGGPDVLSYGEMINRIAELMLVHRPSIELGLSVTPVTARVAAAIAGEHPELVLPLMGSLRADLLPADDHAAELLGVNLHSFDAAVEHALAEWEAREPLAAR